MSSVAWQISVSLDGLVAGPDQSLDNPLGVGGMRLHQWAVRRWDRVGAGAGAGGGPRARRGDRRRRERRAAVPRGGMLEELYLHIVPVVPGAGERLLENIGDPTLEPVEVVASPAVTHVE
jgi:hypothetical protein